MPRAAKLYINSTVITGLSLLAAGLFLWRSADPPRYVSHFLLALFVSTLKGRLPGITGTVSFGFVFVLIGVAEFSFSETIAIGCATGLVQCVWKPRRRPIALQVLFNVATLVISAGAAYSIPWSILHAAHYQSSGILLVMAATVYFSINTISVAIALALVEEKGLTKIWQQCSLSSYPYFLLQVTFAGIISMSNHSLVWVVSLSGVLWLVSLYWNYRDRLRQAQTRGARKSKRYDSVKSPVEVTWDDHNGRRHLISARILDISEEGARIESGEPISASTVHISTHDHDYEGLAQVCYGEFVTGKYLIGIEFHTTLSNRQLMSLAFARFERNQS